MTTIGILKTIILTLLIKTAIAVMILSLRFPIEIRLGIILYLKASYKLRSYLNFQLSCMLSNRFIYFPLVFFIENRFNVFDNRMFYYENFFID